MTSHRRLIFHHKYLALLFAIITLLLHPQHFKISNPKALRYPIPSPAMAMRRRISQGPCRSTPWYISQYTAKQAYDLPPTPVNSKQHTTSYLHLSTPTHHNSCRFKSLKLKILVPDFYLLPSSTVKRRETDIAGSRRSTSWFISENPPQRTCDIFYHSIKIITFTLLHKHVTSKIAHGFAWIVPHLTISQLHHRCTKILHLTFNSLLT